MRSDKFLLAMSATFAGFCLGMGWGWWLSPDWLTSWRAAVLLSLAYVSWHINRLCRAWRMRRSLIRNMVKVGMRESRAEEIADDIVKRHMRGE